MNTLDKADLAFAGFAGAALDFGSLLYSDSILNKTLGNAANAQKMGITSNLAAQSEIYKNEYLRRDRFFRRGFNRLGLGATPAERAITIGNERAQRVLAKKWVGNAANAVDHPELYEQVNRAVKYRKLSVNITGVLAVSTLASLTSSAVDHFRQTGAEELGRQLGFSNESFSDSRMAYTSRQRALRAIQNSQSGYRRAIGNEASFIHTYR